VSPRRQADPARPEPLFLLASESEANVMQMRAARMYGYQEPLRIEEVPVVQYAKLLGGGAVVVAFARDDSQLDVAKENGADHGINVRDKSIEAIQDELERLTERRTIDAILDCVGSEASISMGFDLLGPEGALAAVGLMSQRVEHRQFPFVGTELSHLGSFWGNQLDLGEMLSLAEAGLVKHNVTKVELEDINENLEALGRGDIVGRQVSSSSERGDQLNLGGRFSRSAAAPSARSGPMKVSIS
jgi:Zinc-binding dehydrogenase